MHQLPVTSYQLSVINIMPRSATAEHGADELIAGNWLLITGY
jgi:hypothetical protein